jgi:choline-glycine betaine transporter
MKRILFSLLAILVVFVLITPAHVFLINRGADTLGNRLIYDDDVV